MEPPLDSRFVAPFPASSVVPTGLSHIRCSLRPGLAALPPPLSRMKRGGTSCEDAHCNRCLVRSLRPVLATRPAGPGALAGGLAARVAIPPGGHHVHRPVRAAAGDPAAACSASWLALGTNASTSRCSSLGSKHVQRKRPRDAGPSSFTSSTLNVPVASCPGAAAATRRSPAYARCAPSCGTRCWRSPYRSRDANWPRCTCRRKP